MIKYLDSLSNLEAITEEDRVQLKSMLQTEVMRKALAEILKHSDAMSTGLLVVDLTKDEGVRNAIRTQGTVAGISFAIELLIDLTTKEGDEDED